MSFISLSNVATLANSTPFGSLVKGGTGGTTDLVEDPETTTQEQNPERFANSGGGGITPLQLARLVNWVIAYYLIFVKCYDKEDGPFLIFCQACFACCCPECVICYLVVANYKKCFM